MNSLGSNDKGNCRTFRPQRLHQLRQLREGLDLSFLADEDFRGQNILQYPFAIAS